MKLEVLEDADAVAERGAEHVAAWLGEEPALTAAIATGRSPIALYERLAAMRAAGTVRTDEMIPFQLDAYLGVPDDDPRSLWGWMERAFLTPLGIDVNRAHRFDALTADPVAECERYDAELARAGGLGLAVLGLGPNGHLGFNEPPSPPDAPTRAVVLTPESIRSNGSYWGGEHTVPERGMTLGMSALLASRRILLVVTGAHKHEILRRSVEERPDARVPASWLQRHRGTFVLADRAAWEGIPR